MFYCPNTLNSFITGNCSIPLWDNKHNRNKKTGLSGESIVLLQACRAEKRIQSRKVGHKLTHTCLWCYSGNHGAAYADRTHTTFSLSPQSSNKNEKYYSSLQCLGCDCNRSTSDQLIPADPVGGDSVFNCSGNYSCVRQNKVKTTSAEG